MAARPKLLEPIHGVESGVESEMALQIMKLLKSAVLSKAEIASIVNGKRSITADTALRLGKYFGATPQTWMGLQTEYDLRVAHIFFRRVGATHHLLNPSQGA